MFHLVTWRTIGLIFCLGCSRIVAQICGSANEFLCRSGDCISKEFLCDGSKECIDGSDETHDLCKFRSCSQSIDYVDHGEDEIFIPTLGTGKSFRCGYGACIPNQFICDGIRHCIADGSDETEELCSKHKCAKRQFRCKYGGCVMRLHACDNRYQCFDQSDETAEACKWRRKRCTRANQFRCANGACIRESNKCNGKNDCLDKSDESVSTCGPRDGIITDIAGNRPTVPPPTIPSGIVFPSNSRRPVIPSQPTTKSTPINVSEGGGKGCEQTDDENIRLEIIACGDTSFCIDQILPPGTVMVIYCDEVSTPLRCQEDGLWHFAKDPSKTPRKKPCQDTGSSAKPISSSNKDRIFTPVPTDCGILSPFTPIPWLVGLFRNGNFSCTGTIIGPALILTAGHCVVSNQATNTRLINPSELKIQFQSENPNNPQEFASVSGIELHPNYMGGESPRYDMALLFLTKKLAETHGLGSACLDDEGKLLLKQAWTFNRTVGQTTYRWDNFQQTFDRSCVNKATICTRHLHIGENQFCAINEVEETKFLHQGASGGPYMIAKTQNGHSRWAVAGVVSSSIRTTECGTRTLFTYVNLFRNWIINCGFHGNCVA